MEQLELLRQWLQSCPVLEGIPVLVDDLGKLPVCASLRPVGITQLWEKKDIAGGIRRRYRLGLRVALRLPRAAGSDGMEAAARWLALQCWVPEHPAPALGQEQVSRMEQGKLAAAKGDGTAVYEAVLTVEYTRNG